MTMRSFSSDSRPDLVCAVVALLGVLLAFDLPVPLKLILLLSGVGVAALAGPVSSLCLVCLSLPLASTTVTIGSTEWSPLELALLTTGSAVAIRIVTDLVRNSSPAALMRWIGPPDLILIGAVMVGLAALSLLWLADTDLRPDSLRALRRVIVEPLLVLPAVVALRSTRDESRMVQWLVWPAIGVSLLAITQLALQRSTVDIGGISRPIGTFTHPNNLAFYLERVIWFCPLIAMPLTRRFGRMGWCVVAVVLIATLTTLSRGAVVALAIGGTVMLWEEIWRRWRLFAGLAVAGISIVFASRYIAQAGDSIDSRTTIWRGAIDMVRDHPLTGIGLDQFLGQYGRRYVRPEGWAERYTSHPHNLFLDFWLSLGIAGLGVLWLLLEATWNRLVSALRMPPWSVQRAGIALVMAGLAHGLIDNCFFLPYLATMTWLGLAVSSTPHEMTEDG
jgi:putative inorganic carbon (hco3(-)) transporter